MHLVLLLTFGFTVCGPAIIEASERRIIFVVPRYIKRSFDTQQFFEHREPAYKTRRSPRRPYLNSHLNSAQFYVPEKHRVPQGSDDFDQNIFTPRQHQRVRHVVIPHGEGITHGISFGKGYIPNEEFNGMNEEFEFPVPENNNLDFGDMHVANRGSGRLRFEENGYNSQFQNQEHGVQSGNIGGNGNAEWPTFSYRQQERNYGLQEEPQDQAYKSQSPTSSSSNEEIFFPKFSQVQQQDNYEERRSLPQGITSGVNPTHPAIQEHKPAPLIFQDTIDMKEYIDKIQAFARSWPHAASIQTFGWQNQIPNPQVQNFNQGFNPWSGYSQPRNPETGYQVQEESAEESNRRNFRQMMT